MNFELNEQQKSIQMAVREFANNELKPGVIERDESSTFSVELYKKMGELGFIGLPISKEYGGQGLGYLEYALAVEEISKVDASMGISYSVSTSLYCGSILNSNATEEQKKSFLPEVAAGKVHGAFGLTEPNAGSDAAGIITTATKEGNEYVLNGMKIFNTNGPIAGYYAIYALTEPEKRAKGLSCFIVKAGTPGLKVGKIENKMGIKSAQVSEIILEDVRVPEENKIALDGKGFGVAMKTLDGGRIGVAAQGLGIAEGAFDIAISYLKEREQFGKPLYRNQYLAFKMAELSMEIEAAKFMLYKACADKDNNGKYSLSAAKAKYMCTNAAMHVTTECVQMLGGNGYMKEYHVERMMRDAKITQIYEGTNEIQKLIVSGALFS
ncbi:acyl-CoA dehydrogenase family protein [Anaerosphaera multitolerans]|uniref:Acyl-CoA dehydrogenase n=1 Tax=Anaerosphaera multitolerans TaxID=2487351 RepID=A0A437S6Y4_9FIRM|nr:acyl-CoA dehydrogenase family protein [Anaerosphaera multitolerans]RVU54793.1 acyl-CoA dehydrogenase [Anaerosphaera multitolerans]